MLIKNTSDSPRGIYTKTGHVIVEAGQTAEVELTKDALEESSGWFVVEKAAKTEAKQAE